MKALISVDESDVKTIIFALSNSIEYIENYFNYSTEQLERCKQLHLDAIKIFTDLKFKY